MEWNRSQRKTVFFISFGLICLVFSWILMIQDADIRVQLFGIVVNFVSYALICSSVVGYIEIIGK